MRLKEIGLLLIFILITNSLPLLAAWNFSLIRPAVNIDYLFALAFFVIGAWPIGLLIFISSFLADIFSLVGQLFPFFRFGEIKYMSRFIFLAPSSYQVGAILSAIFFVFLTALHIFFAAKVSKAGLLASLLLFGSCFAASSALSEKQMTYRDPPGHFASSQIEYFFFSRLSGFSERVREGGATFVNHTGERATSVWDKDSPEALPNKMMLVVSESWGVPNDPLIQELILRPILELDSHEIEQGALAFSGSTVEGELKELCALIPSTYDIRTIPEPRSQKCLPAILKEHGYNTSSFHGASSTMYDRYYWYPRIGFDNLLFFENHSWKRRCHSFPGACDIDIFNKISNLFRDNGKHFVYWLTLNSHSPYDGRDIFVEKFNCDAFPIDSSEVCNNLLLHAQYFYYLSNLLKEPRMSEVEVIVVGDHEPRFLSNRELLENNFEVGKVPWIRISPFKK